MLYGGIDIESTPWHLSVSKKDDVSISIVQIQ